MRTRRERIISHIVKSSRQGDPSSRAIRNWNNLEDQRRFGNDPTKLRRHFEGVLPKNYNVTEDLTVGLPGHKHGRKSKPGQHQGEQANPVTWV